MFINIAGFSFLHEELFLHVNDDSWYLCYGYAVLSDRGGYRAMLSKTVIKKQSHFIIMPQKCLRSHPKLFLRFCEIVLTDRLLDTKLPQLRKEP